MPEYQFWQLSIYQYNRRLYYWKGETLLHYFSYQSSGGIQFYSKPMIRENYRFPIFKLKLDNVY